MLRPLIVISQTVILLAAHDEFALGHTHELQSADSQAVAVLRQGAPALFAARRLAYLGKSSLASGFEVGGLLRLLRNGFLGFGLGSGGWGHQVDHGVQGFGAKAVAEGDLPQHVTQAFRVLVLVGAEKAFDRLAVFLLSILPLERILNEPKTDGLVLEVQHLARKGGGRGVHERLPADEVVAVHAHGLP